MNAAAPEVVTGSAAALGCAIAARGATLQLRNVDFEKLIERVLEDASPK